MGSMYGPAMIDEEGGPSLPGLKAMVSSTPSENGLSNTRKWGVKDHVERLDLAADNESVNKSPINWLDLYAREKATIERLTRQVPEAPPAR